MNYRLPEGLHRIPDELLDLRTDDVIDSAISNPGPVSGDKNIWFFWHDGYEAMHSYSKRNIRSWHRRFSRCGWTVRVVDTKLDSLCNIAVYLDVNDPDTFPRAFSQGTISGQYAKQHTSDLVRWPLLLKYGGVYADVGLMQIGDLEWLWNDTIDNPDSPYEVLSYDGGNAEHFTLTNYFMAARKNNALFHRCHKIFLALWAEDGGKQSTEGMHANPLLRGVPLLTVTNPIVESDNVIPIDEVNKLLTDYIIQGQVTTLVLGLIDEHDNWDGPEYTRSKVYAIDFMVGAQLINDLTEWNGPEAYRLMSLPLPQEHEEASDDQIRANAIVEACLQKSFGFKLAHGMILRVLGDTLGSLWRKHEDSDNVPGTYAHWLRHATMFWTQDVIPSTVEYGPPFEAIKRGSLLSAD